MLRRVENIKLYFYPTFPWSKSGQVRLRIGRVTYTPFHRLLKTEYELQLQASAEYPVRFGLVGGRSYWLYRDRWYWDNDHLTAGEVHALLVLRLQQERARVERALAAVAEQHRSGRRA